MSKNARPVFLYDVRMDLDFLSRRDVRPDHYDIGALDAWRMVCDPWPRIEPKEGATIFGIVAPLSHKEIARLYDDESAQGRDFRPEATLVRLPQAGMTLALTYTLPFHNGAQSVRPELSQLDEIIRLSVTHGFPDWYTLALRSIRGRD